VKDQNWFTIAIDFLIDYWKNCWSSANGSESYNLDCPKGVSDEVSTEIVKKIAKHPKIQPHLTQWTGHIINLPSAFSSQITSANMAVTAIDAELAGR
jgi:hypothetical protein